MCADLYGQNKKEQEEKVMEKSQDKTRPQVVLSSGGVHQCKCFCHLQAPPMSARPENVRPTGSPLSNRREEEEMWYGTTGKFSRISGTQEVAHPGDPRSQMQDSPAAHRVRCEPKRWRSFQLAEQSQLDVGWMQAKLLMRKSRLGVRWNM